MSYRLISEEELERLDLDPDNYKEPIWYFDEEKAKEIYADYDIDEIPKDRLEEFTEYLKAFIKVSPEELDVLNKYFVIIVKKAKKMFENK